MKRAKGYLALLSAAAMLFGLTACGGAASENSSIYTTQTTTTIDDEIENPVDISDLELSMAKEKTLEPCTLRYVSNYDLTLAGDIKPAYKVFQEKYGCNIEAEIVAFDSINEKITLGIQSGDSPDLVDRQDTTFPQGISQNLYSEIDGQIDLTAPHWEKLAKYINEYNWKGHTYYCPWSFDCGSYWLVYNRGLFEAEGLNDPYQMYLEGNWTWDTMKQSMVDFVNNGTDRLGMYGYFSTGFVNSNGVKLIDNDENGKLINNMKSPAVEQAQLFLESLRKEGLTNFAYNDGSSVDLDPVIEGNAAFHAMGGWIIGNYAGKMHKDASLDIFFVPIPRSPYTDKYYYAMTSFGYLVPSGSKHVEAACTFIDCCRMSKVDEELKETTKQSMMKKSKYTEEMYDFMISFANVENFDGILDESFGASSDISQLLKDMLANVAFDQSEEAESWPTVRDTNFNVVQDVIDTFNAANS